MTSFPWLTVIGVVPLAGAIVLGLLPKAAVKAAKLTALGFAVVTLGLTLAMAAQFDPDGPRFQFTVDHSWISTFGAHYALGVDGIALVLIGMAAVLFPVVILASWHEVEQTKRSAKTFYALILSLETIVVGVFAATDVFLFYVFFEASLVPIYFLIGSFGGKRSSYAAVKFLLYNLLGGLLMLAAIIALYFAGPHTFLYSALTSMHLGTGEERWLFLGFFIAFAIKAPLWPFHTWLPDAAAEGPVGGTVLLVGVLDKIGTFGFLRYCLTLFPNASHWFAPVVVVLAVIAVIYGALCAIGQRDLLRLVAYTSVSHFGLICLGVFAFTSQAQSGATLYMVNHGITTGALFLLVGFMIARRKSRGVYDFGGMQKTAPLLAGAFLVACMSALALPGLNSFVSEFLVLVGTFERYKVAAGIATVGIILAALYMLLTYQRTMTGPVKHAVEGMRDLSKVEIAAIAPLVALMIALGFYPKPVLEVINPAVDQTMALTHTTNPPPDVTTTAQSGGSANGGGSK